MSRTCRRVPLDFDWPIDEVWEGYIHPTWRRCPGDDCDGGSTTSGRWLECISHLILMLGEERGGRPLHPWLQAVPLAPERAPGPDAALLTGGLAGRPPRTPFGHDAIDRWHATNAIIKAAGLPDDWGICAVCKGHAIHPDDVAASESWEKTDPPIGAGWQLWETTSEGSPVSPVFGTPGALAKWCATNARVWGDLMPEDVWLEGFLAGETDINTTLVGTYSKESA